MNLWRRRKRHQRLAGLEHEARQPRLTTEAEEGAAAADDRVKHNGDSSSARRVDDGPTTLINFGKIAEPPALPCKDDAQGGKGAEVPKPCLSPVEMRSLTAFGGLLPAGTASIAMRTIFCRTPFSWSRGEETEKITSRTNFNQLVPRC